MPGELADITVSYSINAYLLFEFALVSSCNAQGSNKGTVGNNILH